MPKSDFFTILNSALEKNPLQAFNKAIAQFFAEELKVASRGGVEKIVDSILNRVICGGFYKNLKRQTNAGTGFKIQNS